MMHHSYPHYIGMRGTVSIQATSSFLDSFSPSVSPGHVSHLILCTHQHIHATTCFNQCVPIAHCFPRYIIKKNKLILLINTKISELPLHLNAAIRTLRNMSTLQQQHQQQQLTPGTTEIPDHDLQYQTPKTNYSAFHGEIGGMQGIVNSAYWRGAKSLATVLSLCYGFDYVFTKTPATKFLPKWKHFETDNKLFALAIIGLVTTQYAVKDGEMVGLTEHNTSRLEKNHLEELDGLYEFEKQLASKQQRPAATTPLPHNVTPPPAPDSTIYKTQQQLNHKSDV